MRLRRRVVLLVISLAVGVSVVVAVAVLHRAKAKEAPAFAAWMGVLRQRPTPLPAGLRLSGFSPTEARFALVRAGRHYFVAPGSGQGSGNVCLIEMGGPSTGSSTCSTPPSRGQAETVFESPASHGAIAQLAGVAADGFDRASLNGISTHIVNNVFAFDHVRVADHFIVYGPAGKFRVPLHS
jgi:hypothetical protein